MRNVFCESWTKVAEAVISVGLFSVVDVLVVPPSTHLVWLRPSFAVCRTS